MHKINELYGAYIFNKVLLSISQHTYIMKICFNNSITIFKQDRVNLTHHFPQPVLKIDIVNNKLDITMYSIW